MPEKMGSNINADTEQIGYWAERCPTADVIFSLAQKGIQEITGLSLTNIELSKLHTISQEVERSLKNEQPNVETAFPPVQETMARFLFENYGIDIPIIKWHETGMGGEFHNQKEVKEWFRQKQEEQHLL